MADGDKIVDAHPGVLAVSGPRAYEEVVGAVPEEVEEERLAPGQIVQAVVEHADQHDLWATLV